MGRPRGSTGVREGTMAVTQTPTGSGTTEVSSAMACTGPRRQAAPASCSMWSGSGVRRRWGTRDRATTWPSSSTATALVAVVPMSIPTVSEPDTVVIVGSL
jgi:hypothetical protein